MKVKKAPAGIPRHSLAFLSVLISEDIQRLQPLLISQVLINNHLAKTEGEMVIRFNLLGDNTAQGENYLFPLHTVNQAGIELLKNEITAARVGNKAAIPVQTSIWDNIHSFIHSFVVFSTLRFITHGGTPN